MEILPEQTPEIPAYIEALLEIAQRIEETLGSSDPKNVARILGETASKLALLSDEIAATSFELSLPQADHDQQDPQLPEVLPGLNILNTQEAQPLEEKVLVPEETIITLISTNEFDALISQASNPKFKHILEALSKAMAMGQYEVSLGAIRKIVDDQDYDINVDEAELRKTLGDFKRITKQPLGEIISSKDKNPKNIRVRINYRLADTIPQ